MCVCVCMYVCMYVCTHMCVRICMCVCARACVCMYVCRVRLVVNRDVKTFCSLVCHQGRTEVCQVTHKCRYICTKLHTAKDSNQETQLVLSTQCVLWRDVMIHLLSCGEMWRYIYCPLTYTPCSTATLQQIHTAISVPFRSWCHNLNADVNTHWCCYQRYRSHSMHCSSSHSTLTASCHIGWTYCSPVESPIISVKRKTCFIMLYQLVCHTAWTMSSEVLRQDTAVITDG